MSASPRKESSSSSSSSCTTTSSGKWSSSRTVLSTERYHQLDVKHRGRVRERTRKNSKKNQTGGRYPSGTSTVPKNWNLLSSNQNTSEWKELKNRTCPQCCGAVLLLNAPAPYFGGGGSSDYYYINRPSPPPWWLNPMNATTKIWPSLKSFAQDRSNICAHHSISSRDFLKFFCLLMTKLRIYILLTNSDSAYCPPGGWENLYFLIILFLLFSSSLEAGKCAICFFFVFSLLLRFSLSLAIFADRYYFKKGVGPS